MSNIQASLLLLNSAITHLSRRIRRVDDQQAVGKARLSALAVLYFGGPCSMTELAASEMVSPATMHHVVRGLEEEDLAQRVADPHDRRRQIIQLTKLGTRVIKDAHKRRIQYYESLLEGVSDSELTTTARTLGKLRDNAASIARSHRP